MFEVMARRPAFFREIHLLQRSAFVSLSETVDVEQFFPLHPFDEIPRRLMGNAQVLF